MLTQSTAPFYNSAVSGHPVCIVDSGTIEKSIDKRLLVMNLCLHNGANYKTRNLELHRLSASYANKLLKKHQIDILGLSEHWLSDSNIHFLESINRNYTGFGVSDNDLRLANVRRLGKGGIAIMWHNSISNSITCLDIESDRICGIQLRLKRNNFVYILQIYAPCSNISIFDYINFVDYLQSVISMYAENGSVIVMGDVNAHLQGHTYIKQSDNRGRYVQSMLDYHNLVSINSQSNCLGAHSTFVSYDDFYESLIDHILIPDTCIDTVSYCEILDDDVLNVSRHRPIVCELLYPVPDLQNNMPSNGSHIKWKQVSSDMTLMYRTHLDESLRVTDYSNVPNVTDRITQRYDNIATKINSCSDIAFPKSEFRRYLKPYWDQNLKNLHAVMRQARRQWISEGRPRGNNHTSYRKYKTAKSIFRSQHRKCADNYLSSLNAEIDQFAELDSAYFWKRLTGDGSCRP